MSCQRLSTHSLETLRLHKYTPSYLACKVFWQLIIHFPTVPGPFLPARDDCLLGRFLRSNCPLLDVLPFSTVLGCSHPHPPLNVVASRLLLVACILLFALVFGSLVYPSLGIHPDVSYAVATVSLVFSGTRLDAVRRYLFTPTLLDVRIRTSIVSSLLHFIQFPTNQQFIVLRME